jgi:hypothetical protein
VVGSRRVRNIAPEGAEFKIRNGKAGSGENFYTLSVGPHFEHT